MIASLLVANRGEIAVRIFRTARAMGVKCVAVYSDADAKAKHVRDADVALRIGPPPAKDSYLNAEAILRAAKESGAEAIHPGYGFLSENPEFAEAVIAAGLIWVGPTPAAIRAMGLKDEAKAIAEEGGVPVLPGYRGADQSEKVLREAAKETGFPVLIKAVAGGGGRGIREVRGVDEFAAALASAKRESAAAFGDDRVLIEKLVERPRHIEVQVFGDSHGNLVHLFERDCSLQRRRQKVIEEAPAPGMTDEVRAAMTGAALKLARAVKYENAGTVEFIVDGGGPLRADGFWFMEMNTRLQVEHPVTECVTGLDLVEWQLRVASGEALPRQQSEVRIQGHAIEARICAEEPAKNFQPSVGKMDILSVRSPEDGGVWPGRIDWGYASDDEVSPFYDNLIAKMVCAQLDRQSAIADLDHCLSLTAFGGVTTNIGFLVRCLRLPEFSNGQVHTGLVGRQIAYLCDRAPTRSRAAKAYALRYFASAEPTTDPWTTVDGWRLNAGSVQRLVIEADGELEDVRMDSFTATSNGYIPKGHWSGRIDGERALPEFIRGVVVLDGEVFSFAPAGARVSSEAGEASDAIAAPLPGKVVALNVKPGAAVKRGDPLVVVEAMKMEHALKAPRDGVVAEIGVAEGDQVKQAQMLVRLEPREEKH